MPDIEALKADLEGLAIEDNPRVVQQKSRDFYWYSPVLKRQLEDVTADLVITPKNQDEVVRIVTAAYAHNVPITVRGTGTGNYGQAMPLSRGIVLNMASMAEIKSIEPGRVTTGAGAVVAKIDEATKAHSGQELRMHPSTAKTATIGGFIAGGSGGVGSINWGGLRDLGNVIRLTIVTMEETPRVLDLTGFDLQKVSHAYGTNGIITEVEMPLTQAHDWIDVLIGFDDFMDGVRFGNELGNADGIAVKEIAPIAAPAPHLYFKRHQKFVRPDQSVVVIMVAPNSVEALAAFAAREKGDLLYRSDTMDNKGLPVAYELAWNHTTLRALRIDPAITYLQTLYPFPNQIDLVEKAHKPFVDAGENELIGHLEFVRFDGNVTCFGLPLLRFTTDERLDEIIKFHEDIGCPVFNPHRYTLEEGGMKQTDEVQLDFKRQADPKGLLNPGKMIAWEDPEYDYKSQKTYLFPGLAN